MDPAALATMATALSTIARDMKLLSLGQETTNEISGLEARAAEQDAAMQNLAAQVAQSMVKQGLATAITKPEDWALGALPHTENNAVTGAQVAEMIQAALLNNVAPALGAAFKAVDTRVSHTENRLTAAEQEMAKMKVRVAWAERDGQYAQIEVAKKTAVARSWPKNFTAEDRMLTIHNALHNSKIDPEDVDIFTQRFEHAEGEVKL